MEKNLLLVSLVLMLGLVIGCSNDTPTPIIAPEPCDTTETNTVDAVDPTFSGQLLNATYVLSSTAIALDGSASVTDGGTVTYQWYKNISNSTENGTAIDGAKTASYTPKTTALGTSYYYVVATNNISDNEDGGNKTATAVSKVATIIVRDYIIGDVGPGGGTIYCYDSTTGEGKEVSEKLDTHGVKWEEAEGIIASCNSDGINNWTFPTLDDLKTLYAAKVAYGILQDESSWVWSSTEKEAGVSADALNFAGGSSFSFDYGPSDMGEYEGNGLYAIRTFNTSS